MSDNDSKVFASTVKNLLNTKPKPHDEAKGDKGPDKKDGGEQTRRRPASSTSKEDH